MREPLHQPGTREFLLRHKEQENIAWHPVTVLQQAARMLPGLYLFMFLLLLLTACAWICLNFVLLVPIVCLHMRVCMHTHTHTSDPWSGECTQRFKCTVLFFCYSMWIPIGEGNKGSDGVCEGHKFLTPSSPFSFSLSWCLPTDSVQPLWQQCGGSSSSAQQIRAAEK